jgi:hypothetical protein
LLGSPAKTRTKTEAAENSHTMPLESFADEIEIRYRMEHV